MLGIEFNSTVRGRANGHTITEEEIVFKDGGLSVMEVSVNAYDANQISFSTYESDSDSYGFAQLNISEWDALKEFIDKNISQIKNN